MKFFILLLFWIVLFAKEDSIDDLLMQVQHKTDLSEKTKLENGGVTLIYTRSDLDRMQAKSLKDILISAYPFTYRENRYAISDPYNMATQHPFLSTNMRIYIDNQEITNGLYGSGLVTHGDIDIGFVDHIEFYIANPTYEFSTESTFVLVKLYSKSSQKDEGSRVSFDYGSYNMSNINLYTAKKVRDGWSYFTYASYNDNNKRRYNSFGTDLSRDNERTHVFATFKKDKNNILIDFGKNNKDTFIDSSLDATPTKAKLENQFLHIGYDTTYKKLSFLLSYDDLETKSRFRDDVTPMFPFYLNPIRSLDVDSSSYVVTSELKYKHNTPRNKLVLGFKYRYKGFKYTKLLRNDIDLPRTGHTHQQIYTSFIENHFSLKRNSIITIGLSTSSFRNNHSLQNDDLYKGRFGHTYTTNNLVVKTIITHLEDTLTPYLVNSYNIYITDGKKKVARQNIYMENIIYNYLDDKFELILLDMLAKNQLIPDLSTGLLYNNPKTMDARNGIFKWTHDYNDVDKFYFIFSYTYIDNLADGSRSEGYYCTFRNLNSYKKFDFFNELLYKEKDSFDLNLGVKYHYTQDFSISFKGTNILDKGKEEMYFRIDPTDFHLEEPLSIPIYDRSFLINMEYLF